MGTDNHTPLRLGMVGGGKDAFIGAVHRLACRLDDSFILTAGALSSTPEKSVASARELGLAPERSYGTWQQMLDGELKRPRVERIDAVTIVTPNHTHAAIARAFAEAGIPVACDKPLTSTLADAQTLAAAVEKSKTPFCVSYNYTGYPMVRHAAHLVRTGAIGAVRKCFVEYHQGWLATKLEDAGQKQAAWRNDPAQAGGGGAIGDIGSHAENLLSTVTGLEIEQVAADLTSFVPGRKLDDDAAVFIRMSGTAKATLTVCQVAIGEENNLTLRIHGDKGSLWWRQEEPNHLTVATLDGMTKVLARGSGFQSPADSASRLPPGHPEGFIEAFANIYKGFAQTVRGFNAGKPTPGEHPGIHDGLRGVRFVDAVVRSGKNNSVWTSLDGR
ncbi:MAG: Gfo/Idh/MocA family oxidoreductase [Phycisphaerales bacterium]|nr:Gfo/Idh/MocA family oxidoreductase [Phycisphaerales bacterium]